MKLLMWMFLFTGIKSDTTVTVTDLKLNKENLWQTIQESGIKYPDIAYAQALLESGDLKSRLVRTNKNLFGMRKPTVRKTTAVGINSKYAIYAHWTHSVHDYKLWQEYLFRKKTLSRAEYIAYIQRKYSETSDYMSRVRRVLKKENIKI